MDTTIETTTPAAAGPLTAESLHEPDRYFEVEFGIVGLEISGVYPTFVERLYQRTFGTNGQRLPADLRELCAKQDIPAVQKWLEAHFPLTLASIQPSLWPYIADCFVAAAHSSTMYGFNDYLWRYLDIQLRDYSEPGEEVHDLLEKFE